MTDTQSTAIPEAPAARTEAPHSFATALCGFVGSTLAATMVMVLLGSV